MYSVVKRMDARATDPRGFACCLLIALLILPPENSSQTAKDYERAMADFHEGDYSSAAELFGKVDVASPGATEALLFEGKCLIHPSGEVSGGRKSLAQLRGASSQFG